MRVFVAGATGAIGQRLIPQLLEKGHEVFGTARSDDKAARLRAQGATPVVLDLLAPEAVREAVLIVRPDAIIHQATALGGAALRPAARDFGNFDRSFAATNLLRTRGTDALLAAAVILERPPRFIAQSYTGWPYARTGGAIKTEEDPLDPHPARAMRETLAAIQFLETRVVAAGGLALRYGALYGAPDDPVLALVRQRRMPIIGNGGGIWSFVHLDDAAAATVLALERGEPGVYNIVDDEPAPVREWLPALAAAGGAPRPRHVPAKLVQLLAGSAPVVMMTDARGASNAKARRELGWTPRYPSWRTGFVVSYGPAARGAPGVGGPRPDAGGLPAHGAS
jgi:nucleoside-diphosphate-sugar epimerase